MTNLLPPIAKRAVKRQYWQRMVSVWLLWWAVTAAIAAAFLLPTYVLLSGKIDAYATAATVADTQNSEYQNLVRELERANRQAELIIRHADGQQVSKILQDIRSYEISGITLTGVVFEPSEAVVNGDGNDNTANKIIEFKLQGTAATRETLVRYRDQLLGAAYVADVALPISNLAQNQNIPFTLLVTLNEPL